MNMDFVLEMAEKAAMLEIIKRLVSNLDDYDVKRVMFALFKDDEEKDADE